MQECAYRFVVAKNFSNMTRGVWEPGYYTVQGPTNFSLSFMRSERIRQDHRQTEVCRTPEKERICNTDLSSMAGT
jgi:hypothetical protein